MTESRKDRPAILADWRCFRWHAAVFVIGALVLYAVRSYVVAGGWYFWVVSPWLAVLGAHYLVVKSFNVDDDWADERAIDLRYKSYDKMHLTQVVDSAVDGDPDVDPAAPKRR